MKKFDLQPLAPFEPSHLEEFDQASRLATVSPALIRVLSIGMAFYALLFLGALVGGYVRHPYSDAFDFIAVELRAEDAHDPGAYLWLAHNGHHLVWMRLLTALDIRFFRGSNLVAPFIAALALIVTASQVGVSYFLNSRNMTIAVLSSFGAGFLFLTSVNAADASQPINAVYALAMPFVVGAVLLFEVKDPGPRQLFGVGLLAFGACLGNTAAIAVAPALVLSSLSRPGRPGLLGLCLIGALLFGVFLLDVRNGPQELASSANGSETSLLQLISYFVVYCGLPWTGGRSPFAASAAIGIAVICVSAAVLLQRRRRIGEETTAERVSYDFILFSLFTAVMAAFGRSQSSDGALVPVRYALFMAPLHAGLLYLLIARFKGRLAGQPRLALTAIGAFLVAMLGQQVVGLALVVRKAESLNQTLESFERGMRDPAMAQIVYPDLTRASAVIADLKRRDLYQH